MDIAFLLIGFSTLLFSLIYLVVHFLRKIRNRNHYLSKKIFYSTFVGGLVLFIIGSSLSDTGIQKQLDDSIAKNTELVDQNEKLQSDIKKLTVTNEELQQENDKLSTDLEKVTSQIDMDKKFESENKTLQQQVAELTENKTSLETQVNELKDQLESEKKVAAASSSSTSSNSNSNVSSTNISSEKEYFANCTELRTVYPSGVSSDHPAYQSKMDRDKDGWACEK